MAAPLPMFAQLGRTLAPAMLRPLSVTALTSTASPPAEMLGNPKQQCCLR